MQLMGVSHLTDRFSVYQPHHFFVRRLDLGGQPNGRKGVGSIRIKIEAG
jgi:hypothetical protein